MGTSVSSNPMNMGLGRIGASDIIFKRKFRWLFEVQIPCHSGNDNGLIPGSFVKVSSRPNIDFEETQIDFLNGRTWIPGKATWQTITVTYIDVATADILPLYNWLASVYNFTAQAAGSDITLSNTTSANLTMGNRQDWAGIATLTLFDGCGSWLEQWALNNCWPQAINWGDLDMESSDMVTIELTLRYDSVGYVNYCPGFSVTPCCTPCA